MRRNKISVIGAGNVGATTAQRLSEQELGDVVLVDIIEDMPQGKALDLAEAAAVLNYDAVLAGSNRYDETADSDIVVITSGIARKPGMSREDLIKTNAVIVKEVTARVAEKSPDSILIIVSNPLDAMTYLAHKVSGFPRERVLGMAGALDTARFRAFIAMELGVSIENVQALVVGSHGDFMVPMIRYTNVAGVPVADLIPRERLVEIVERAKNGGAEIVKLLKTGSAFYAPSAAVVEMVDAILKDKKKIIPCCVKCEGEFNIHGVFAGVPVILGIGGMEKVFEMKLTDEEGTFLRLSAVAVKKLCAEMESLM